MPIDWGSVNWTNVLFLSALAFVATLIGNFLSFRRPLLGAVLTALLFAAFYIVWVYYPHGIELPGVPKPG
ncbi:MAG TPA: hypothetical protein VKP67_04185 [Xanthobacteraceae bacterium]|nr:hypothetical protein [Xanthobacteraceae bacterium]